MVEACPDCRISLSPADACCPQCARPLQAEAEATPAVPASSPSGAPPLNTALALGAAADPFRSSAIMAGILLLVGFAMPVLGPDSRVIFPNFEAFGEFGDGGALRFQVLFPGIAGILVVLAGLRARGWGRAGLLLGLGLIEALSLLALTGESSSLQREFGGTGATTVMLLAILSWTTLLIGAHSATVRHDSRAPAIIGSIGAALFLLYMFLPLLKFGPNGTQILAAIPFKMLDAPREAPTQVLVGGIASLLVVLTGFAASLLAFLSLGSAQVRKKLAAPGRMLVWLNLAFLLGTFVAASGAVHANSGMAPSVAGYILFIAKGLAWLLGILILMPLGASELVVSLIDSHRATASLLPAAPAARVLALAPAEGVHRLSANVRMSELLRLRDAGLISADEFESKRQQIVRDL